MKEEALEGNHADFPDSTRGPTLKSASLGDDISVFGDLFSAQLSTGPKYILSDTCSGTFAA